jgi:uncharacterized Tic20 family protein
MAPGGAGGPSSDDRTLACLAHLSIFAGVVVPFGNIIAPLVIWLVKKEDAPFVAAAAREALNFQITVSIVSIALVVVGIMLVFVLPPLFLIVALLAIGINIGALVLVVLAAIKASGGEPYDFPFNFRLV